MKLKPLIMALVASGAAQKKACFEAIEKSGTGNIQQVEYNGEQAKIKAMVEVKKVTWDMVKVECSDVNRGCDEGLLQTDKVWQIGLRGTGFGADDFDWPRQQGFTVVPAHEVWTSPSPPLMARVRESIGQAPCYLSFDIDGIDPSFAGGTGTPEVGGLTVPQALEIIRGCWGMNLVGDDLVEVSPLYDRSGNTALLCVNLLFEMLCVLPGVSYRGGLAYVAKDRTSRWKYATLIN